MNFLLFLLKSFVFFFDKVLVGQIWLYLNFLLEFLQDLNFRKKLYTMNFYIIKSIFQNYIKESK
jgi:hypothetical protein